ncbi:TatD family hydrolase [Mesoterricola sediminis]|uniref:TatD family hydrolase n=1 Tax=Mesoterricola sediminis TaxID=2927980 RepID=A0AA48GT21_9BACT|nr:TatD family hydrolase [Mesoterricola sediminis]BDU77169.1 TatD family hydrolase [Mesoterricola sediminis]
MLVDAHCHLQDPRLAADLEGVLARARAAGVGAFVVCGTREADWGAVLDLARTRAGVIPFAGLHPWHVAEASPGWEPALVAAFHAGAGAGEAGLDFSEGRPDRDLQEAVLAAQVRLAAAHGLPLALHAVKAADRLAAVLRRVGLGRAGGYVHAFSGAPEVARTYLDLGLHLSFGGAITRPGATRAQAALAFVPRDRYLLETDAPDLAPAGVTGPNEPAHLALIAAAAGRIRGEDAGARAADNARTLLGRWLA